MPAKESADLLIEARWVLPIAPVNTVLNRHALAIKDGKILAIGPSEQLRSRFEARDHAVRDEHALLPGFVNAHTHAAMTLLRGSFPRLSLMRWLRESIWPKEHRWVSSEFVRDGTQLAIAEMLHAGVTSFGDMYPFPNEAARVAAAARVRAVIGLPIAEAASPWAENATAYLAKAEQLWDEYKAHPWVSLEFAPHAPYSVSDGTLQRLRRVADELDARIVMHVHETEDEVRDSLAEFGCRPLRRLDNLGLLRPGFTAVHMNWLDEDDLKITARTGVSVVTCPQSNMRLGSGRCPVAKLANRGVCIGIGTDGAASVGALDMLAEARAASLLNGELHAEEFLRMATLGSATTLGLGSIVGSLEAGKAADFICINLESLACHPQISPVDAVLHAATRHQIGDVWIAGRPVVASGRLLAFDEQELAHLARDWGRRIYGELA